MLYKTKRLLLFGLLAAMFLLAGCTKSLSTPPKPFDENPLETALARTQPAVEVTVEPTLSFDQGLDEGMKATGESGVGLTNTPDMIDHGYSRYDQDAGHLMPVTTGWVIFFGNNQDEVCLVDLGSDYKDCTLIEEKVHVLQSEDGAIEVLIIINSSLEVFYRYVE